MRSTLLATATIVALNFAAFANAGVIGEVGVATWTFPDEVQGMLTAQIQVDVATAQALLKTDALNGATLTLDQQAFMFSSPQNGPGDSVGEFATGNFVTGTELISVEVPDYGTYEFAGSYQVTGANPLRNTFSISFVTGGGPIVPEPTSLALMSLAGVLGFRRRR